MKSPLRVVLDTNVFVAALLKADGKTARLLSLWQKAKIRLIFSEETIHETLRVLAELDVSKPRRQQINSLIRRPLKQRSIIDRFLEVAVAGRAQHLVTNNRKHFSDRGKRSLWLRTNPTQDAGLRNFRGVHIVSIGEFLKLADVVKEWPEGAL